MKIQNYKVVQMIIVVLLAGLTSSFVVMGSYIVPLIALVAASGLILIMKRKVKEVMADERDIKIGGQAGRMAYSASAMAMAVMGMIFMALRIDHPDYYLAGQLMSFSACGMILIYSAFFWYYSRKDAA